VRALRDPTKNPGEAVVRSTRSKIHLTVSRVLNSPELVAEPARERVLKAIRDLDYVVNELARQIGTGRRPYIGILSVGVATTPFAADIISAVEQGSREHGWRWAAPLRPGQWEAYQLPNSDQLARFECASS
jgi:hypothetical protein